MMQNQADTITVPPVRDDSNVIVKDDDVATLPGFDFLRIAGERHAGERARVARNSAGKNTRGRPAGFGAGSSAS